MTIGFLVKTFPKLSETFILEEILGLERLGVNLHIVSLNYPKDQVSHGAIKQVRAPISYIEARTSALLAQLTEHSGCLLRNPWRYGRTLAFLARRTQGNRLADLNRALQLATVARQHRLSHLHTHFIGEPADVAELTHLLTGIPFSISAHAKDIYLSPPAALKRKMGRARFTVTCTEYNRSHLAGIAAHQTVVRRMYHGVDTSKFCCVKETKKETPPLILSVGRLREKKGFHILIQACRALQTLGIAFRCEIVGYGEERDRLQSLIHELGLAERVKLAGKMPHEQLVERYRAASLFVLPCVIAADGDRDGIPNVLLEAMAMELPVVSTAVSGIPEVIKDRETGLLVAPEDAAALAQAMSRVLGDPTLAQALASHGRRSVQESFCNDHNLVQLCELLQAGMRPNADIASALPAQEFRHVG